MKWFNKFFTINKQMPEDKDHEDAYSEIEKRKVEIEEMKLEQQSIQNLTRNQVLMVNMKNQMQNNLMTRTVTTAGNGNALWNGYHHQAGQSGITGTTTYIDPTTLYNPYTVNIMPNPFGVNKDLLGTTLYKTIITVTKYEDISQINFQPEDIVLCLDTMKYYRCLTAMISGLDNLLPAIANDKDITPAVFEEVRLLPNNTIERVLKPVVVQQDKQEVFDAFEKNLELNINQISESKKPDTAISKLLQKAKGMLQTPLESDELAYG